MNKSVVNKALTADEKPTAGYLYKEIAGESHYLPVLVHLAVGVAEVQCSNTGCPCHAPRHDTRKLGGL